MLTHKHIGKITCGVLVLCFTITAVFMNWDYFGIVEAESTNTYVEKLFSELEIHSIDIIVDTDTWNEMLDNASEKEYITCTLVIDGETFTNIAIRTKGNSSLQQVQSSGSDRYSFKIEFDHYDNTTTYYGLDKLCLNNIVQDNTYMKDYIAYDLMNEFGVASPLSNYVDVSINGETFGLYLAVEAVEDAFLQRNYGDNYGNLYKPETSDDIMGGMVEGMGEVPIIPEMGQEIPEIGQEMPEMGQEMPEMGQELPEMGQELPEMSQEMPEMGQELPEMSQELPEMSQELPEMSQEMPDIGQEIPEMAEQEQAGRTEISEEPQSDMAGRTEISEEPQSDMSDRTEMSGQMSGGMNDRTQMMGGMSGSSTSLTSALGYDGDDPTSYSYIFDNAVNAVGTSDQTRLISSIEQLNLQEDLEEVVDVEQVIRYFIVHNFLLNFDSYTGGIMHNYYLYEEDGVMTMLPWDYNLSFVAFQTNYSTEEMINFPIDTPVSSGTVEQRPMLAWIFSSEEYTAMYHELYQEFIDELFLSGYFEETVNEVEALISDSVESDPSKFCTFDEFVQGVATLQDFVALRVESICGQLDGTIGSTDEAQAANPESLISAGDVDVTDMGTDTVQTGNGNNQSPTRNQEFTGEQMMSEPMIDESMMDETMMGEPMMDETMMDETMIDESMMVEPMMGEQMMSEPMMSEQMMGGTMMGEQMMGEPMMSEQMMSEQMMGEQMTGRDEMFTGGNSMEGRFSLETESVGNSSAPWLLLGSGVFLLMGFLVVIFYKRRTH